MYAATVLSIFIQEDDGSLENPVRVSVNALRNRHDLCIAEFVKLEAEIAYSYNAVPALPVDGGDLEFVRDRYEALVRQKTYLAMAVEGFV